MVPPLLVGGMGLVRVPPPAPLRGGDLPVGAVWVSLCRTRSNSNGLAHDKTEPVVVGTPDLPLEPAEAEEGDRV